MSFNLRTVLLSLNLIVWGLLPACGEEQSEVCDDGIDNDEDAYIDCLDQDCWTADYCGGGGDDDDSTGDDDDSAGDDDDSAGDDDDSAGDDDDSAGDEPPCVDNDGDGTCLETDCDDFDAALNSDDVDGDGVSSCTGDCNDGSALIHPAADELCDGIDNNCDGNTDDESSTDAGTWYGDADNDGYGSGQFVVVACTAPTGYSDNDDDCNDLNPASYPGASEECDEEDNDCDLSIDEDVLLTFFTDADSDGYGDIAVPILACELPASASLNSLDCDDGAPSINPAALEICDSADNNCDGSVNESTALDAGTWFVDSDNDGFGLDGSEVQACTQPTGSVALGGDCNDGVATIYPTAPEICDGTDSNCDGSAITLTWFQDSDGDGYGDQNNTQNACSQPAGFSASSSDCDDGDATASPASFELCDGVDNDCDSLIDDADPSLPAVFTSTWYLDGDGDGFGNPLNSQSLCFQPSGYVADGTDCIDSLNSIHPGASEVCDGTDNNCNNLVDDADPEISLVGAPTFFTDSDGDGLGDPLSPVQACTQPTGAVTNNNDCDDTNNVDTDADGTQDCADDDIDGDGLPNTLDVAPFDPSIVAGPAAGSGSDGSLVVSGTLQLDLGIGIIGDPDPGDNALEVTDASSLQVGDEALIIVQQGGGAGDFEFVFVTAINNNTLSVVPPLNNDIPSSSLAALYRVPHYTDLTVPAGTTLAASAWNGSHGGVLVVRASGDVVIDGTLSMTALGFRGGPGVTGNNTQPQQGESYPGIGGSGNPSANGGGGGAHQVSGDQGEGGGGGGHGSAGAAGTRHDGNATTDGGTAYGDAALAAWHLGSGGGAGTPDAEGDGSSGSNVTGTGGAGGGLLTLFAGQTITLSGSLTSDGANGTDAVSGGGEVGGGGGGSGGQIQLSAPALVITGLVSAVGGSGGRSFGDSGVYGAARGGAGGDGRIRLDYATLDGVAFPSGDLAVTSPIAGHQESPAD